MIDALSVSATKTKAAMKYQSKHHRLYVQTYLVSEVEKEPYAFLRVVHKVHLTCAHFDEAVDEGKVAAHSRLPGQNNPNVSTVRDRATVVDARLPRTRRLDLGFAHRRQP